jgi:hypothetical protein
VRWHARAVELLVGALRACRRDTMSECGYDLGLNRRKRAPAIQEGLGAFGIDLAPLVAFEVFFSS